MWKALWRMMPKQNPRPSAGVLDSQTVKPPPSPGGGGCDVARKMEGRERHAVVDTGGGS
jgi:hypothetical protein